MVRKDAAKQDGKSSAAAVAAPADKKETRVLSTEEQDALLASFFSENVYARRAARRSILVLLVFVACAVSYLAYRQHTAPFEGPAFMLHGLRKAPTSHITAGLATMLATLLLCAGAALTGSRALLNGALLSAVAPLAVWGLMLTEHGLWLTQPHLYALPLLAPVSVRGGSNGGTAWRWRRRPHGEEPSTLCSVPLTPLLQLTPSHLPSWCAGAGWLPDVL